MTRFPPCSGRCILLVLILLSATGCHSWRTVNRPVPEAVEARSGKKFRVGVVGGLLFEVDSGYVRLDTLVVWRPHSDGTPQSFPLTDVIAIQDRKVNLIKTVLVVTVVTTLPLAIAYASAWDNAWDNWNW